MTESPKRQRLLTLVFIAFLAVGCIQHYLAAVFIFKSANASQYYFYSYVGIITVNLIYALTVIISNKYPIIFYMYKFLEMHFIITLIKETSSSQGLFILFISLLVTSYILKNIKGLIFIIVFTLINYTFSVMIGHKLGMLDKQYLFTHSFDIISIISIEIVAYIITTVAKNLLRNLEQAREEIARNKIMIEESLKDLNILYEISRFTNGELLKVLSSKELIKEINSMILKVIKPDYCSIFLTDEKNEDFITYATNREDQKTIPTIKEDLIINYLTQFKTIGLNLIYVNLNELADCQWAKEKDIQSFLVAPLQVHKILKGLILIESKYEDTFDESKRNMIGTICNQVSIAIENSIIYDEMKKIANIDGLTQVYNRRYFNEKCLTEFSKLEKSAPICVAMIDIDNFKKVNDTYGHLIGDSVLKKSAGIIKSTVNPEDSNETLVARYGGEEFVVLMKKKDLNTAYMIFETVRKYIESSCVDDEDTNVKFTISIGLAEYPSTSKNITQILKDADTALYKAKQTGKNKVVMATIKKEN